MNPTSKQQTILSALRHDIMEGVLPPGTRVPSQGDIASRFSVSQLTAQRAIESLRDQGFVRTEPRIGTFVSAHPPHLSDIAVVFPVSPGSAEEGSWSRFYDALQVAMNETQRQHPHSRLLPFYGLSGHTDTDDYRRITASIANHQLAGIIFANSPHHLLRSPIMDAPDIPRVAFMSRPGMPGLPIVAVDRNSFFRQAIDRLADLECKRLALISYGFGLNDRDPTYRDMLDYAGQRGVEFPPYWMLPCSRRPASARQIAWLLAHNPSDRPQGLIIDDDNLAESSLDGLARAGLDLSSDIRIICHANFPFPPRTPPGIALLGYDLRALFGAAIDVLTLQRRRQPFPPATTLPAIFEGELPPLAIPPSATESTTAKPAQGVPA